MSDGTNKLKLEDLPDVLEVIDIQEFMKIGRDQAYALCKSEKFHTHRIGRLIKIPKQGFVEWFLGGNVQKQE